MIQQKLLELRGSEGNQNMGKTWSYAGTEKAVLDIVRGYMEVEEGGILRNQIE